MSSAVNFPVLTDYRFDKEHPNCPRFIDWALLVPHEPQALITHRQTLKRLASRGGLSPQEIYAVMHGVRVARVSDREAVDYLLSLTESTPDLNVDSG